MVSGAPRVLEVGSTLISRAQGALVWTQPPFGPDGEVNRPPTVTLTRSRPSILPSNVALAVVSFFICLRAFRAPCPVPRAVIESAAPALIISLGAVVHLGAIAVTSGVSVGFNCQVLETWLLSASGSFLRTPCLFKRR